MRELKKIVVHCSATQEGKDYSVETIRKWHTDPKPKGRGWSDVGYHYIIRNDEHGTIELGRDVQRSGAHVKGENADSIGICYVGGVDKDMKAKDTMTDIQEASLRKLVASLRMVFGDLKLYGHNDFTNTKACPSFKVKEKFPELVD
jgi:N-acetylmuramoyl-L-alanine amidase